MEGNSEWTVLLHCLEVRGKIWWRRAGEQVLDSRIQRVCLLYTIIVASASSFLSPRHPTLDTAKDVSGSVSHSIICTSSRK